MITPGWKTSEFAYTMLVNMVGAFMVSGLVGDGSTAMRVAGMAAMVLKSAAYTFSRSAVKAADVRSPDTTTVSAVASEKQVVAAP